MKTPMLTKYCWILSFTCSPRADGEVGDDIFEVAVRAETVLEAVRLALDELPIEEPDLLGYLVVEGAAASDFAEPEPPAVVDVRRKLVPTEDNYT